MLSFNLDEGEGRAALAWLEGFMEGFDVSRLSRLTVDHGKGTRTPVVWGVCRLPTPGVNEGVRSTYRISCHLGRKWPRPIRTRKAPLHKDRNGWIRRYAGTTLFDTDEAVVWIASHELFHFLRATNQVGGTQSEIRADAFADARLAEFRGEERTVLIPSIDIRHSRMA